MPDDWMGDVCGVEPQPALDPAPGLARLEVLATAVEGADSSEAGVLALAALLQDEAGMIEILASFRVGPDAVVGLLTRIGARRGLKGHTERLLANLKAKVKDIEVEERRARFRVAQPDEQRPPLDQVLGWDGIPANLFSPPGWGVTPSGIQRHVTDPETGDVRVYPMTTRPLLVTGRLKDVGDGTTWVRLDWGAEQRHGHRVVPRGQIADSRMLTGLADYDAPIHSGINRDAVEYLADFEAHNRAALPEARTTSRMGWQDQSHTDFLWGRTLLRPGVLPEPGASVEDLPPSLWKPDQVHLLVEGGAAEVASGFRAGGTWEGWRAVVQEALPYSSVILAIYAALVPPLMPLVPGLPNFIVDWSGITSTGKTTTLRLGASVWGSPDERGSGLMLSWDATNVWIERTIGTLHCLPMFLDDTKRARRQSDVARVIYEIANGVGRGRGSLKGTCGVLRWRTVLLSNGETPLVSFTQDGGTRARTLCLWGSPFGTADETTADVVAGVNAGVFEHHGHAGPRMIAWLLDDPSARDQVRQGYKDALAWWTSQAGGNPVAGRAAQYMAALTVARNILHGVLGVPTPPTDPLTVAWEAVCEASSEADRATEALRDILSWAASQQGRFHQRLEGENASDDDPPAGWLGAWSSSDSWRQIAFLPTELHRFLQGQGYDTEAVLRAWEDRSWLLPEGPRHRTRKVKVGSRKARCYVVTRAACDLLEEADDE